MHNFKNDNNDARVLVTGGSGFIGTNAMDFFINQKIEAHNLDIKPPLKNEHAPLWEEVDFFSLPIIW